MMGMNAPTAVESAPETAETQGLVSPSSRRFQTFAGERVDESLLIAGDVLDETLGVVAIEAADLIAERKQFAGFGFVE